MFKVLALISIPLVAGCFAWDMDRQDYPWTEPNPVDTSIGQVVWLHGEPQPPFPAETDTFPAFYVAPQARARMPVPPPPAAEDIAPSEDTMEPPSEAADPAEEPAVEAPAAPPTAPSANAGLEKKIENLEQRLEELYQLLLKSYEKK